MVVLIPAAIFFAAKINQDSDDLVRRERACRQFLVNGWLTLKNGHSETAIDLS